jgi:hypothetical protein
LFSALMLAFAFVLAEVGTRMTWRPPGNTALTQGQDLAPHRSRLWALPEGPRLSFGNNYVGGANGLRVVADTGAPLRGLTLGDSSIFGHGLADADTLHGALRRSLGARGVEMDVFTGAVPGYSSEQSRVVLEEEGWDLKPNLLIIGNLWSDTGARGFQDRAWLAETARPTYLIENALRKSYLWWFLRSQVSEPVPSTLPVTWIRDPDQMGVRRVPIQEYAENLDWMLREASARGIAAVFLTPCNRHRAVMEPGVLTTWEAYFEVVQRLADRRSVPVVHGCDVVRRHDLYDDAGFLDDMHPTAALNQAYADQIAAMLFASGWPERPLLPDPAPPPFSEPLVDTWVAAGRELEQLK